MLTYFGRIDTAGNRFCEIFVQNLAAQGKIWNGYGLKGGMTIRSFAGW
ncbi:MAG: hypothetical protein MI824_19055 [Hyphomicrobiales bacterium]|nr:hypothetical protein [Hyphomicrobiales bacterium]